MQNFVDSNFMQVYCHCERAQILWPQIETCPRRICPLNWPVIMAGWCSAMARAQAFVGCLELNSARLYILLYNQDGIDTAEATNSIQMNN